MSEPEVVHWEQPVQEPAVKVPIVAVLERKSVEEANPET